MLLNTPPIEQTKERRSRDEHYRASWLRHELNRPDVAARALGSGYAALIRVGRRAIHAACVDRGTSV
jgi:hypothetical protein